jgi:hypothetical protein
MSLVQKQEHDKQKNDDEHQNINLRSRLLVDLLVLVHSSQMKSKGNEAF